MLARRPSQQKHFPPARRLLYCVLKGLPRLDVTLHGLPAEAAAGELLRAQVRQRAPRRERVLLHWRIVAVMMML